MDIVIAGANGFLGSALANHLHKRGHRVTGLVRNPDPTRSPSEPIRLLAWSADSKGDWRDAVAAADAVVNLAGASVGAKRWSPAYKELIRDSRILTTRSIVDTIRTSGRTDQVLVNSSAVGFYGACGDRLVTEQDPPGSGFMAELCAEWEAEARRAKGIAVRVIMLRTGIVLGEHGALAQMLLPFRLGFGGPLGSGRQWMSWIHHEDAIAMIAWAVENREIDGPLNLTTPNPVTNRKFASALGRALRRPSFLPVPAVALRLLLGEFAEALLTGQRVLPAVAEQHRFAWQYPQIAGALRELIEADHREH